jgi:DNA-binding protein HU-beta
MKEKHVNRSQLIEALAAHYEGNKKAATKALDAVVDTITREVSRGEKVAITGFGAFEKAIRPARTVRNPATGEPVQSEEKAVPRFRPGTDLKAVVAGVRSLPALTLSTAANAAAAVTETAARATGRGEGKKGGAKKTAETAAQQAGDEAPATKSPAKKASKKAPARTAPSKKAAATAPAKAAAKKATAKKATAKKSTPQKQTAAEKTAAPTPSALADPPAPDTSSRTVLSTGPAETAQPGQS